jgi:hypothetical protein
MQTKGGFEAERDTLDALMASLQALPHAQVSLEQLKHHMGSPRFALDAEIHLNVGGRNIVLLIELKKVVYPRDIRQILWQLSQARKLEPFKQKDVIPLVAAQSISIGARDLLKAENIGFYDTGGSLFVPAKGAYLYIDRPVPKTIEKSVKSLFTGKRSQVLHALLLRREDWIGVSELAKLAEVSPGTASETLTALERMELVTAHGQGPSKERRLSNASGLLDEWRTQSLASPRPIGRRRYYVPGSDSNTLAHQLADLCDSKGVEYALSQDIAAQNYAPFLSNVSRVACRMAPGKGGDEVIASLDARVVSEGANLDIIETKSHGELLFREYRQGLWLASPVQVYLDLLRSAGRSREMADHLRKEVLGI